MINEKPRTNVNSSLSGEWGWQAYLMFAFSLSPGIWTLLFTNLFFCLVIATVIVQWSNWGLFILFVIAPGKLLEIRRDSGNTPVNRLQMPKKDSILVFSCEREIFLGSVLCAGWVYSVGWIRTAITEPQFLIVLHMLNYDLRGEKHMVVTD